MKTDDVLHPSLLRDECFQPRFTRLSAKRSIASCAVNESFDCQFPLILYE